MACPNCGCKTTYQYDGWGDDADSCADDRMERCAACGHVFDVDDHADEDEDDALATLQADAPPVRGLGEV